MQHDRSCGSTGSRHGSHNGGCRTTASASKRSPSVRWHGGSRSVSVHSATGIRIPARSTYVPCPGVLIMDHFFDGRRSGDRWYRQHRPDAGAVQREPRRPRRVGELRGRRSDAGLQRVRAALLRCARRRAATAPRRWSISTRRRGPAGDKFSVLRRRRRRNAHWPDSHPRRARGGRDNPSGYGLSVWRARNEHRSRRSGARHRRRSTCIDSGFRPTAGDAVHPHELSSRPSVP